jgi:peptidoglycan/LPS O-acetylase OafA/YrhL
MQNILKIANISLSSPNIEPVSKDQWAMLGVMRFFLALVVLCEHSRAGGHYDGLSKFFYSMDARNAVMLFFIISGFSIASSIESGAKIGNSVTFYLRRLIRIAPTYWFACIITWLTITLANGAPMTDTTVHQHPLYIWLGNIFWMQNLLVPLMHDNGPTWSLGCEVVYYLFAPLIARCKTKHIAIIVFVLFAISLLARFDDRYGATHLKWAWIWLSGYLAYRIRGDQRLMIFLFLAFAYMIDYTGKPLIASLFLFIILTLPKWGVPENRLKFLNELGGISYVIYIVHFPLLILFNHYFDPNNSHSDATLVVLLGILIGWIVYHYYDKPVRRFLSVKLKQYSGVA